ncbi:MAG: competence protein CoiA family protein [Cyclobacteriaceae bacterium]
MKFALYNGEKVEATKGINGTCPNCGSVLVAKCGSYRLHHWAHKGARNCDSWWENETPWHRSWKNRFPADWQEISLHDVPTGEKHITDIRTPDGLVIEFQHSHINPRERSSREKFYKNMVWVVDGTRLKRDYSRFLKAKKDFLKSNKKGIFLVDYLDECFPSAWIESLVPVIFDFHGSDQDGKNNSVDNKLYCLFPISFGRYGVLAELSRSTLVKFMINGEWIERTNQFINKLSQEEKLRQHQEKMQQQQLTNLMFDRITRARLPGNRRRRL